METTPASPRRDQGPVRGWTPTRAVACVALAVFVVLVLGQAVAHAGATQTDAATAPTPVTGTRDAVDEAPARVTGAEDATEPVPDPTATEPDATDQEPGDATEDAPDPVPTVESGPDAGTTQVRPSVRRSGIPVGTILLAVAVLAAVALAALAMVRRPGPPDLADEPTVPRDVVTPTALPSSTRAPADDREVIAFLLDLGEALVDAGDPVDRIGAALRNIASTEGLRDVGVIVLPTALIISVPGRESLQTDVTAAGKSPLRLDQVAAVLRVVDEATDGRIGPAAGRARLAEIRASRSPVRGPMALAGHGLTAVGLALILRGGVLEVGLAAALGAAVGGLQLVVSPRGSSFRPFLPLVAAFMVATSVFLAVRVAPGLAILPPLVAPLIPFLPGGLLTVGTLELATGQAVSGVARLGSGGLQLVLLAGGVLGAAQFVGVPGPTDIVLETTATSLDGDVGVLAPWVGVALSGLAPWVGVALFGLGLTGSRAAPRSLLPWILLVLYVAYAGQIMGGLFFGNALSGFFGAFAMTPVAVFASRQRSGPPALVTFLPAFWLLVPGALGLEGVTRILSERGVQGVATLVTTGGVMVGIAMGILLGLLVTAPDTWPLREFARSGSEPARSVRPDE